MPSKLVLLSWDDGYPAPPVIGGGPSTPPVYPGHGLPGGMPMPGHDLPPGHAHVGGGPIYLPVFPFDPTTPVGPESPDRPSTGPIEPGRRYIVKWLACVGLILVPDNTLPDTPQPK